MNSNILDAKSSIWKDTKECNEKIRQLGIDEFIRIFNGQKNRKDHLLKWGDEVEYMITKFDHQNKKVRLSTKCDEILKTTDKWEKDEGNSRKCLWKNEYASYMIESITGQPYSELENNKFDHLIQMENNLKERRKEMRILLDTDEELICITAFPKLGCEDFTYPKSEIDLNKSLIQSIFVPESIISYSYPRFKSVQLNIDGRRGRKVIMNIPIFKDINTPNPFVEKYKYYHKETEQAIKADHIYMDAFVFGFGCSCLQVTFQASNLTEARQLYDQLAPITSIMLALSASAPIFRGYLSEIDSRWSVLKQGTDDRTKQESGEEPIKYCDKYKKIDLINFKNNKHEPVRSCECGDTHFKVPKSRYDSISLYISELGGKYNDQPVPYNIDYFEKLIKNGVDNLIALHISHLFIKDSVSIPKRVSENETEVNNNFENIQSTNWQSLRFKPPPKSNSTIGWRIEFRVLDLQMTDFENSAYAVFIILLTRVILKYNLNLLIPMSKTEDNMNRSDRRDAVNKEKFWFRKNLSMDSEDEYEMMTIDKIMNGNNNDFIGLIKLIRQYLKEEKIENDICLKINSYLDLLSDRSTGKCLTNAKWIRNQIQKHPDYKFDSIITDQMNYDLLCEIKKISDLNSIDQFYQ